MAGEETEYHLVCSTEDL